MLTQPTKCRKLLPTAFFVRTQVNTLVVCRTPHMHFECCNLAEFIMAYKTLVGGAVPRALAGVHGCRWGRRFIAIRTLDETCGIRDEVLAIQSNNKQIHCSSIHF